VKAGELKKARKIATEQGIVRFEAWTREDSRTCRWYEMNGFKKRKSYLHLYFSFENSVECLSCSIPGIRMVGGFAQYTGDDWENMRKKFKRVHECRLYELIFRHNNDDIFIYSMRSITNEEIKRSINHHLNKQVHI
jgi:ribosomal protein L20A (L18A)